jgi:hypothetical protein
MDFLNLRSALVIFVTLGTVALATLLPEPKPNFRTLKASAFDPPALRLAPSVGLADLAGPTEPTGDNPFVNSAVDPPEVGEGHSDQKEALEEDDLLENPDAL